MSAPPALSPARKLTLLRLIAATYFIVSGGPFGLEDTVAMAGYGGADILSAYGKWGGCQEGLVAPVPPYAQLTKFAPVLLVQLHFVFPGSGFDALPGGVAFSVGNPFHLLEAGDCVAHVSSVMDGFFTLLGESEVFVGDMIAASFIDLGHAA